MLVPGCFDPVTLEEGRQLRWDRRVARRRRCVCCEEPVRSEVYLDLEPFGVKGVVCEGCRERYTYPVEVLDDGW